MKTTDTDVLILGGGCAGLSLAVALARYAPQLAVTTLEQRKSYTRDRTWCFWNSAEHPFEQGITHSWKQWRVSAAGEQVRQTSDRYCYQHLPADHFYTLAQHFMEKAGQKLLLETQAGETARLDGSCETQTTRGAVRSRWVFDARTPASTAAAPAMWQRFQGWHVRAEQPCFDPHCVGLMDFELADDERIAFFYTLPFSRHEALVEVTYLDFAGVVPQAGEHRLRERLEALCPGGYSVLYTESGALPMGLEDGGNHRAGCAVPIGTRGGRVKPSSGYAFERIQRQSRLTAQALGQGRALPVQFESRVYSVLDNIFLQALTRHPERAASYFLELFRRVPADLLVPFLSETAGPRAILSTMLALPKQDFALAAMLPQARSLR